ncbi:hypothetical protein Sjap_004207 [Stephania japonica]|uniref:Zinc finger, CCHC-type n=1 Tax=Stephania japonica TaxID=461633 RepID=A0AAP0K2N6_9MAGN
MRIISMSTILLMLHALCWQLWFPNFEGHGTNGSLRHGSCNAKEMFQQQARQERFETVKNLYSCKMTEGASVSPHVLKMKGYVDQLDRLGFPISQELATDLILNSLLESYSQFVMNYNMNNMEKSISELHLMLKTAEQNIKKPSGNVLMVQKGKGMKKKGKGKAKVARVQLLCSSKASWNKSSPTALLQSTKRKRKEIVISPCTGHWFEIANSIWKI